MANFCIMRIEKRRDMGSVRRCAEHHLRTVPTPNADPTRSIKVLVGSSDSNDVTATINDVAKSLMKRKDAIRAMDVFCGASPDFFAQGGSVHEFETLAVRWAAETFGADNIVLAVAHSDELTFHVHLLVTPVTPKGNLSASHWLDGPKKLRHLQDTFAEVMKPLGLERGVEGSKAKHQDVKTWYGALEPAMKKAEKIIEHADQVQVRMRDEKAKNLAEATKLTQAREALVEWQNGLKAASAEIKTAQEKLVVREQEIVKKETFFQRLATDLEQQKKMLLQAFGQLPTDIQAKLAAIFKREKTEVVQAEKSVVMTSALKSSKRQDVVPSPSSTSLPRPMYR